MITCSDRVYKWLVIVTVGVGVLTSTLDGSIVNLAYPVLTEAFHTEASTVLWVTVAFLLVSAGLALPLGSLGDMLGRRRVFTAGLLVFTLGLGLVTISQSIGQLIGFRVLQGIGQGMLVATGNALVVDAFPERERGKALGINGAMVGIGLAGGPVLGGVILDFLGWRALFWTRLPISILGVAIALLVLRPDKVRGRREEFDYGGTLALMIGLSALLLFINRAPLDGVLSPMVLGLGVLAVVGLGAFALVEQRATLPIFDFGLLRQRLFAMAVTSSLFQFVAQAAFLFLMPFYLLQALGMRPIEAGPVLMTLPITRLIFSPISGVLSDRLGSRTIATFGLLVMAAGYLVLLRLDASSSLVQIVVGLVLAGSGSSIFLPPNNSVVMGSVSRDRLGMAAAIIPTVRQVGISVGIALTGTIYAVQYEAHQTRLASQGVEGADLAQGAVIGGYGDGFAIAMLFVVAAVVFSALRGRDSAVSRTSALDD